MNNNDKKNDIEPSKEAGFKTCLFVNEEIKNKDCEIKPDYEIESFIELLSILTK